MRKELNCTRSTTLDEALRLAKAGWAVLPVHSIDARGCTCKKANCTSPGKHPLLRGGPHAATTDAAMIRKQFAGDVAYNLGIATGRASGIFVLDVDPRHGGDAALAKLQEEIGTLPSSSLVATGGGGLHYYFRHPELTIRNSAGQLGVGLDIRGEGGYVVAPPSLHHSGMPYTWLAGSQSLCSDLPWPPGALTSLLVSSGPRKGELGRRGPFYEGSRNAALMSSAGQLRRKGLGLTQIEEILLTKNRVCCLPPLSTTEVQAIAASVMRYAPHVSSKSTDRQSQNINCLHATGGKASPKSRATRDPNGDDNLVQSHTPWDTAVEGSALLDDISQAMQAHLIVPPACIRAMALWVVFTHVHAVFSTSPTLGILSPDRRCGKTTAMAILHMLVARPLSTSNITPAALFRAVDQWKPTLLIDEADTFFDNNEELRGILNSGHKRRMAKVIRTVGENHQPRSFSTWCPKVIAKIGFLSNTVADRSIIIGMRRKRIDEPCALLEAQHEQTLYNLGRKAARWAIDSAAALVSIKAETPSSLNDRAKDNWRPLIAIATAAGGHWPQRAADAALCLASINDPEDSETAAILLLTDIRDAFALENIDRIPSKQLCAYLADMDERPWPEWQCNRPITPRQVAKLLRPFGISPKSTRFTELGTPKGYELGQFTDTFARYIDEKSATPQQNAETESNAMPVSATPELNTAQNANEVAVLRNYPSAGKATRVDR